MILEHLKVHGSITQDEAKELYGVGRLSARMGNLKKDGVPFDCILVEGLNRFGEKVRFGKYIYLGSVKDSCPECGSFAPTGECPICAPARRIA
jgi:hypothetical protein